MRNSRRSSNDCALQHPPTDARRVGQPNRPQETPSGRFRPTSPELPREIQGIRNIRGRRHPDCNRRTSKGRTFRRFSLCCRSGKRDSHSRCARAVREYWQTPPAPGRGVLRSHVPSPSCTGIQKQKGESLKILPFALERKTGLALRASGSRILADTPGPWKGRFEVAGAESLMHRHTKAKGRIFEDSPFCFGAENGFPTQAYSSLTISALREAFSSKVTPTMRSSCTRLHPNAFDKDNGKLHLIQAKMGIDTVFECSG